MNWTERQGTFTNNKRSRGVEIMNGMYANQEVYAFVCLLFNVIEYIRIEGSNLSIYDILKMYLWKELVLFLCDNYFK